MTTRPIVLLDCDGPLADFTGAYLQAFEEETGLKATLEDVTGWHIHSCDFFENAAREMKIKPSELRKRCDAHVSRPGFCYAIRPYDYAISRVSRLQEMAEVIVVTSPWDSSPTWMHERTLWLKKHYGVPRTHVIHAAQKHLIWGDVFVDDKPEHVDAWHERWGVVSDRGRGRAVLFDMHHNRSLNHPLRGSWEHVIAHLEDILREGE